MTEAATITIQGIDFPFTDKYDEGHTLTANEASVLTQTFNENLRNNFASNVKKAKEDAKKATGSEDLPSDVVSKLQDDFRTYVGEYEFGTRRTSTGGGGDPVKLVAMTLARTAIRDAIKLKGEKSVKDYTNEQIDAAAEKYLDGKGASLMETARKRIEDKKAAANDALAALSG